MKGDCELVILDHGLYMELQERYVHMTHVSEWFVFFITWYNMQTSHGATCRHHMVQHADITWCSMQTSHDAACKHHMVQHANITWCSMQTSHGATCKHHMMQHDMYLCTVTE